MKYLKDGGFDLMTNEHGISADSFKELKIKKDSLNDNTYLMSYSAYDTDASSKVVKIPVSLKITVVKEESGYKISAVD
ncbi:MAG: hypothetical protein ACOVRN_06240 [Flavobacterium sp.]